MEGLPALTLLGTVMHVSEPLASRARGDPSRQLKPETSQNSTKTTEYVPPHAQESSNRVHVFIFEDNEDVTKMIIKGRSPHMRYVSWTHRVNLELLFERINADANISVLSVHTNERKVLPRVTSGMS